MYVHGHTWRMYVANTFLSKPILSRSLLCSYCYPESWAGVHSADRLLVAGVVVIVVEHLYNVSRDSAVLVCCSACVAGLACLC